MGFFSKILDKSFDAGNSKVEEMLRTRVPQTTGRQRGHCAKGTARLTRRQP